MWNLIATVSLSANVLLSKSEPINMNKPLFNVRSLVVNLSHDPSPKYTLPVCLTLLTHVCLVHFQQEEQCRGPSPQTSSQMQQEGNHDTPEVAEDLT